MEITEGSEEIVNEEDEEDDIKEELTGLIGDNNEDEDDINGCKERTDAHFHKMKRELYTITHYHHSGVMRVYHKVLVLSFVSGS
jgi:hypothetical protein